MKTKIICFLLFICTFVVIIPNIVKADELNYYFYGGTCLDCKEIEETIDIFCEKNNIEKILLDEEGLEFYKKLFNEKECNRKIKTPTLVYQGKIYIGKEEVLEVLNKTEEISSIVLFLGFLDGLNPCAISILLIFSSFLITLEKRKQLFLICLNFIFGEVLCNFLLGFGIFKITNFVSNFDIFSNILYIFTLLICLYVIIINFIDIYNGFKGKEKINNMLSSKVRYKINEIFSKNITSKFLIFISFFIGFIIAILEFGCTGQIYLPSILYMKEANFNMVLGLIIYNIMFSLPLFFFLILALIFNPSKMKENVMKYSYYIKIIVNIVLIILFIQIFLKLIL